jgi:pimeloyl-ACP methyl ester carboxylesterase
MLKKTLHAVGLVFVLLIIGITAYLYLSGPSLPANTDEIITHLLQSPLPEMVGGHTGYAKSGDINIWYESIEPEDASRGAILLFMGISNDAMAWPPKFLDALTNAGYQVIRYDYRGTGMSDWVEDWDHKNPYLLEDMANDGLAVLDTLGIEKAHMVGISMGGMVAQQMTIDHPGRVLSLTSVMSSGYIVDPDLPPISTSIVQQLVMASIKYGVISSERNTIKLHIASRLILMGDASYEINVKTIAEQVLYNLRKRKGYNPEASAQHNAAVFASGSRYVELQTIKAPTLIIHGQSDPFIPIGHGLKCAELIPNADTLWVEGMGHDIPDVFVETVVEKMIINFQEADTDN